MYTQSTFSNAEQNHILFVDDKIEMMGGYIDGMRTFGLKVSETDSPSEAKDLVKNQEDINIVIADMLMPEENGINLIRDIRADKPNIKCYILSSFTDIEELQESLYRSGEEITVLSKRKLPESNSSEYYNKFLPSLLEGPRAMKAYLGSEKSDKSLLDIPFDEFIGYSFEDRIALNEAVRETHSEVIDKQFENGTFWVLLCGSENIEVAADDSSEIWSEKDVMQYAKMKNSAPYQFIRELDIEDYGWGTSCSNKNGSSNYPTVTININKHIITTHFDTGNPLSFFDEAYYKKQGLLSTIKSLPIGGKVQKGVKYSGTEFRRRDAIIIDQLSEETHLLDLLYGIAVRGWNTSRFSRDCITDCDNKTEENKYCEFRTALIGRNLLTDNHLKLILDGENMKTLLYKDK